MMVKREDLQAAAAAGILNPRDIDGLLAFLGERAALSRQPESARFSGTHILYYLGGLFAISAVSVFTNLAVEAMGMGALLALSLLYALASLAMAASLERRGFGIPAGIFATLALALVPLAVYALQHVLGFWTAGPAAQHYRDFHYHIDWRWLTMELATIAVGAALLARFRMPFLVMPIAVTLWYMSMDLVPALLLPLAQEGGNGSHDTAAAWELRKAVSLAFGLAMLATAFLVDLRTRRGKDYAFWLYLFGLMSFCGALAMMGSGHLAGKLFYLAIHFALVFIGAVLGRRTFAVFGGIGIASVIGDLSWHLFRNSLAFVIVLTLLGLALIALGLWWSRHEEAVTRQLRAILPVALREMLEERQL